MSELEQQDLNTEAVGITDQAEGVVDGDSGGAGGSEQSYDVNGEKLSLQQLQEGYLRTADYTRKTQELAQQRDGLKQYQEMESYLKSNPDKATRIYQYLNGNPDAFNAEDDPIKQELASVKYQNQQIWQQVGNIQTERMIDDINRDERYDGVFKSPMLEKALLATHMQLGRKGHLRETADELHKELLKREVTAEKNKEAIMKQNLNSATRRSPATTKTMGVPADRSVSKMSDRELAAEALKMLS